MTDPHRDSVAADQPAVEPPVTVNKGNAHPWATPEYAAQNKQALREFQSRRELYYHCEELLKEALGKPWHPYVLQDGRKGQLAFSRSNFFRSLRKMFRLTEDLRFRDQSGRFDALGWRRTSRAELRLMADSTMHQVCDSLEVFESAGIISRCRMSTPDTKPSILYIFLHGARLLQLLDTVIEKKRLAKAARYSSSASPEVCA